VENIPKMGIETIYPHTYRDEKQTNKNPQHIKALTF